MHNTLLLSAYILANNMQILNDEKHALRVSHVIAAVAKCLQADTWLVASRKLKYAYYMKIFMQIIHPTSHMF